MTDEELNDPLTLPLLGFTEVWSSGTFRNMGPIALVNNKKTEPYTTSFKNTSEASWLPSMCTDLVKCPLHSWQCSVAESLISDRGKHSVTGVQLLWFLLKQSFTRRQQKHLVYHPFVLIL